MHEAINQFPVFLLIFVRVTAFFLTIPIFSYRNIPAMHKIGLGFFLALLIYLSMDKPEIDLNGFYYMLILKEAAVGLFVGLLAYIMMSAIQIAGGFIDFQMGFAIANVIDPQTGVQSPLMGQYLYTFVLLVLLAVDGHHLLLDGVFYSYQIVPLESIWIPLGNEGILTQVMKSFSLMFVVAFQLAAPVVGSLFLVDVALGIVARTVPQLNVFVVGMPLKIIVSFAVVALVIPVFMMIVQNLFEETLLAMRSLMGLMGRG